MKIYRDLLVWQKAIRFVTAVYNIVREFPQEELYGLTSQIKRAAVSIPSNIAEGDELNTDKQAVKHFYIAKGSSAELLTQFIIVYEVGYIGKSTFEEVEKWCIEISRILSKLIKARSKNFIK